MVTADGIEDGNLLKALYNRSYRNQDYPANANKEG